MPEVANSMRVRLLLIAVFAAAAARAGSVTDEMGVNSTQSTDANPRSGSVSDSLNASFDVGESWAINVGAMLTVEGQTPAAERGQFATSASAVTTFNLGADWDATDHFTFGATGNFSPKSTQFAGTQLTLGPAGGIVDNALLQSQSSQLSGGFDFSYDAFGDAPGPLEWSFGAGITGTRFETDQKVTRVRTGTGTTLTAVQLRSLCNTSLKCGRPLLTALKETPATLDSERLSGSVTATLWYDTDLTLSGDYYHYEQDPAAVGYFSVAATGRQVGGNGAPIAPLQYLIRPEVQRRFGDLSLKLWVQAGEYAPGTGQTTRGIGGKLQYKFTRKFRMWLTASGQKDVDDQGVPTTSGAMAMGAGYRF
jgi:hypothetical protein